MQAQAEKMLSEAKALAAEGKHARVDRADETERQAAQRPRSRRPATARAVGAAEGAETAAPAAQPSPGAPAEPPANPPA
jgi:hypothetical protein